MEQSGARNANLEYLCYVQIHISDVLKVSPRSHSGVTFTFPENSVGKNSGRGSCDNEPKLQSCHTRQGFQAVK